MKDWEWFALGLVPFASLPVHAIRYMVEGHGPKPSHAAAGVVVGQGTAWALQKAGFGKVNEALMLYRAHSLGFVEEGYLARPGTGYRYGKLVKGVKYGPLRGSGIGWRATIPMRLAQPLFIAFVIGTGLNLLRTDTPAHGDRYRSNRMHNQPDYDQYI